jgi:tellurite resistance protein TehA-like permease
MEDQDQLAEATKAVNTKIGFYIHLVVYALVNAGLIAINLSTSTEHLWFKWPLLGWGIGVFFHALAVFVFPKGRLLRERMIARAMKKKTFQKP